LTIRLPMHNRMMEVFGNGGYERWVWALLVVVVASVLLADPILSARPLFLRDLGMWHYPVLRDARVGDEATISALPFWTSRLGGGRPLVANTTYALFHPANLLYLIFPFDRAFNLFIALHVILAGVGMLFLARRVGFHFEAAYVAAIAYMMGGYVMSCTAQYPMIAPVAWAPIVLAIGLTAARKPSPRLIALLAFVIAIQLVGGQPEAAMMTILIGVAWSFATLGRRQYLRCFGAWTAAALWACALAFPQLLPAYLNIRQSVRGLGLTPETILYWSFHPGRMVEFVAYPAASWLWQGAPNNSLIDGGRPLFNSLYMGLAVIVLAIVGMVTMFSRRKARARYGDIPTVAFAVTAAVGVVLAFGRYVPGVEGLIESAGAFVLVRYPVKLAATGMESVARKVGGLYVAVIIGVVVLDLFFAHRQMTPVATVPPHRLEAPLIGALEEASRNQGVDPGQWRIYHHRLPRSGWGPRLAAGEVVDADVFFAWQQRMLMPRTGPINGVQHAFEPSIEILDSREYFAFAVAMHQVDLGSLARTLGDTGVLWMVSPQPDLEARSSGELVGVAELGANIGVPSGSAWLYRIRTFSPRVRLTDRYRVDSEATSDTVVGRATDDDSPLPVILSRNPGIVAKGHGALEGSVRILLDNDRRLDLEVSCDRPCLLFVADLFAPGWTARVDGHDVELLRANVAFRAVPLMAGRHRVEMSYRPPGLYPGVAIAMVAGLGLGLCVWPRRRSPIRENRSDQR
jgi:hypothetical protein